MLRVYLISGVRMIVGAASVWRALLFIIRWEAVSRSHTHTHTRTHTHTHTHTQYSCAIMNDQEFRSVLIPADHVQTSVFPFVRKILSSIQKIFVTFFSSDSK